MTVDDVIDGGLCDHQRAGLGPAMSLRELRLAIGVTSAVDGGSTRAENFG